MQFLNQTLAPVPPQPVTIDRADGSQVSLLLKPLPLGFHRRLKQRGLNPPEVPLQVARDATGKPLRDHHGHAASISNPHDAKYLQQLEIYHQHVAVLAIAEALRDDPHVKFESAAPAQETTGASRWIDYAQSLYDELAAAGFTDGDLIHLCDEICRLSNLIDNHLVRSRQNFSPAVPPNST